MRKLMNRKASLVAVPALFLPATAFAQSTVSEIQSATQTELLGHVTSWGGVALAVVAAVVGFGIAISMLKRGK